MPISNTVTVGADSVVVALPVDTKLQVNVTIVPTNNETRTAYAARLNAFFAAMNLSATIQKKMGVNYTIELRPADPNIYEKYVTNAWVVDGAAFHAVAQAYVEAG